MLWRPPSAHVEGGRIFPALYGFAMRGMLFFGLASSITTLYSIQQLRGGPSWLSRLISFRSTTHAETRRVRHPAHRALRAAAKIRLCCRTFPKTISPSPTSTIRRFSIPAAGVASVRAKTRLSRKMGGRRVPVEGNRLNPLAPRRVAGRVLRRTKRLTGTNPEEGEGPSLAKSRPPTVARRVAAHGPRRRRGVLSKNSSAVRQRRPTVPARPCTRAKWGRTRAVRSVCRLRRAPRRRGNPAISASPFPPCCNPGSLW